MVAEDKEMNQWLCNQGNPILYWYLKTGLEQEIILLPVSSSIPHA